MFNFWFESTLESGCLIGWSILLRFLVTDGKDSKTGRCINTLYVTLLMHSSIKCSWWSLIVHQKISPSGHIEPSQRHIYYQSSSIIMLGNEFYDHRLHQQQYCNHVDEILKKCFGKVMDSMSFTNMVRIRQGLSIVERKNRTLLHNNQLQSFIDKYDNSDLLVYSGTPRCSGSTSSKTGHRKL